MSKYFRRTQVIQSQLPKARFSTRRINHLTHKRHQKINDYIHKTSQFIDYIVLKIE